MGNEAAALEPLKARINDPSCPTLDLARALQTHLTAYSQSFQTLADKLGMPKKRTYLSEVAALARLPPSEQEKIKGQVLSWRAIRKLLTVDNPVDS